jgi:hypothetical protein
VIAIVIGLFILAVVVMSAVIRLACGESDIAALPDNFDTKPLAEDVVGTMRNATNDTNATKLFNSSTTTTTTARAVNLTAIVENAAGQSIICIQDKNMTELVCNQNNKTIKQILGSDMFPL